MHYVSLDVRQEDCPLTRATRDHDATFTTPHWRFDSRSNRWTLRIHAVADDRHELGGALRALKSADSVDRFDLYAKDATTAFVRTSFDETSAIETIDRHRGYVIGPFRNAGGTERWHLGFDTDGDADTALSELDTHEQFEVRDRCRLGSAERDGRRLGRIGDSDAEGVTDREREVLETAFDLGYYETPREISLDSLGEELGVSDVAVSKTLRRAERKVLADTLPATEEPPR
jgi:predicted DNA binding protein